jgi:hypothetical protein
MPASQAEITAAAKQYVQECFAGLPATGTELVPRTSELWACKRVAPVRLADQGTR